MKVKVLAATGLVVAAVMPGTAGAATVAVEARNEGFRPAGIGAVLGDDVTWNITSGMHDIEAYAGATFDSGPRNAPGSFTWTNTTGGVVKYRCTFHSTLQAGVCDGMCGVLSDAPPVIAPPSITAPSDGATIGSPGATISGSAPAAAKTVRITDGGAIIGVANVTAMSWSRGFNFSAGSHTVRAVAIDADGFESAPSAPVTFTITAPDVTEPFTQFANPGDLSVQMSLTDYRVLVTDNIKVADVIISARNVLIAIPEELDWTCDDCTDTRWLVSGSEALGTGLYEVTATGIDAAGNRSSDSIFVLSVR